MKIIKYLFISFTILVTVLASYHLYQKSNTKSIALDHIYVLNLDRSVDRYSKIQKRLNELNLPTEYSRFSAIDGKKVKFVNLATKEVTIGEQAFANNSVLKGEFKIICADDFDGDFAPVKLDLTKFHPRTLGEIGCACSHKKIWQDIIKKGYKNALILEDDVEFVTDFTDIIDKILNNIPNDYDYIYIYSLNAGGAFKHKSGNKLIQKLNRFIDKFNYELVKRVQGKKASTVSYIVTESGAKKLFAGFDHYIQVDKNIDNLISGDKLMAYEAKQQLLKTCVEFEESNCDTIIGHSLNKIMSSDVQNK